MPNPYPSFNVVNTLHRASIEQFIVENYLNGETPTIKLRATYRAKSEQSEKA